MAYIYDLDPITSLNEADVFILNTSKHVDKKSVGKCCLIKY